MGSGDGDLLREALARRRAAIEPDDVPDVAGPPTDLPPPLPGTVAPPIPTTPPPPIPTVARVAPDAPPIPTTPPPPIPTVARVAPDAPPIPTTPPPPIPTVARVAPDAPPIPTTPPPPIPTVGQARPLPPIPNVAPPPIPTTPPPAQMLSARGEAINVQPGWTLEQSKLFQDLNDKMGAVAKGFGSVIGDPRNANAQQISDAGRLTQGNPAMLNIPNELKQINESTTMDPATKARRAQEAFARVEGLDKFVNDLQQRTGINDNGVRMLPGLTEEQSKVYQDLNDKMGAIAKGYGNVIGDPMKANAQQISDAGRLTQGNPAMLNIPNELKQINESTTMDPATKAQRSQEAFARVEGLDKFVTDLQQRTGLNNNGVKMLPLLTEAQSKVFMDRTERMRETLTGLDEANDPKRKVALDSAGKKTAVELLHANTYMLDVPRQLKDIETKISDPAERAKAVEKVMAPMGDIDKRLEAGEVQLERNTAANQRGFFGRLADRISSIPDRIRAAVSRDPEPTPPPTTPAITTPTVDTTQKPSQAQAPAKDTTAINGQTQNGPTINSQTQNGPPAQGWQKATPSQQDGPVIGRHRANAVTGRDDAGAGHIEVTSGDDAGHEFKKGLGFATGGKVDAVVHTPDGKTEVDYTVAGHHQVMKMNDVGPDGKANPLAQAVEQLHPGDAFKFDIGRDAKGAEVAHVVDTTTGKSLDVSKQGVAEHKPQAPNQDRGQGR